MIVILSRIKHFFQSGQNFRTKRSVEPFLRKSEGDVSIILLTKQTYKQRNNAELIFLLPFLHRQTVLYCNVKNSNYLLICNISIFSENLEFRQFPN